MARFLQVARRTLSASSSHSTTKTLIPSKIFPKCLPHSPLFHHQTRQYIAEMRKSAFEGNILRILRTEIQYELEYAPPKQSPVDLLCLGYGRCSALYKWQPVTEFNSFTVEDKPGEQWIRLRGKHGEKEEIKVEVTMFDGSVPAARLGNDGNSDDVKLHISLIVDVLRGENCDNVLEFICSAWSDSLEIQKVFMLKRDQMAAKPYIGPDFKDLDDEFQNALHEFLEARGVNDDLAVFLHEYMVNKDKTELIRWLGNVKSYVEK